MKYTSYKTFFMLAAGLTIFTSSCQKLEDFGDTNINPFGSAQPITAALLTNAEERIGATIIAGGAAGIRAGLYAQYFSETQYPDASQYAEPKSDIDGIYSGPLQDLQLIIDKNTNADTKESASGSGSNANQIAVATILKTYYMWTVTDRWGDVPYTEALKGAANLTPIYDKQEEIYPKLITALKAAVAGFDAGPLVKGDIVYAGNVAKWKKFANSLRMLISLRTSKVFPNAGGFAATEFASAFNNSAGYIAANADNFKIAYPGGSYKSPWFNVYDGRSDYAYSKTLSDILNNLGDNRKNVFGASTGNPFPYGLRREDATTLPTSYARVFDAANRAENATLVVTNAASTLLAISEAISRGWIAGNAKQYYDDGVTASFDQWGVTGAAAYIASSQANFLTGTGGGTNIGSNPFNSIVGADALTPDTLPAPLKRIALQRYLAHYPDGIQGWSEWRRSCTPGGVKGTPNLRPTAYATNDAAGKQIPRRFVYGDREYSLHPTNVAAAAARLTGGDVMNGGVWWDK